MVETLTERDLRALLAVAEEGRRDDPTEGMPWAVLDELAGLMHCDAVSFSEVDRTRRRTLVDQTTEAGQQWFEPFVDQPRPASLWNNIEDFLPFRYLGRAGDLANVVRWSDFYTLTELRSTPLFTEYFGPLGCRHSIGLFFPASPGHTRKINLFRDTGRDFTERDRLVLQLLRPHLYEVYLDAQRRRDRVPRLTRREWQVIQLAGQGRSNADIARELFVSVATVRKHLEHVFDRTGARTRAAAAALMMPHFGAVQADRRRGG